MLYPNMLSTSSHVSQKSLLHFLLSLLQTLAVYVAVLYLFFVVHFTCLQAHA